MMHPKSSLFPDTMRRRRQEHGGRMRLSTTPVPNGSPGDLMICTDRGAVVSDAQVSDV